MDFENTMSRINEDEDGLMRDGRLKKLERDFGPECDQLIPEAEAMALKNQQVTEAIDKLLALEKQTRIGADTHATTRILKAIVGICHKAGKWDLLCEHLVLLSKKRGQIRQAVAEMVKLAATYVDSTPDMETKLKYIDVFRTVTAGKIYVENERARVTKTLAEIKEKEGDIKEAATLMQDLQIETYGTMERREKVNFILEQMRLCILNDDNVRAQMISKKVSAKFLADKQYEDLTLRYYELVIKINSHQKDYLEICRNYQQLHKTETVQKDPVRRETSLKHVIAFLILAPHDNERSNLLNTYAARDKGSLPPTYEKIVRLLTTKMLIKYPVFVTEFERELRGGCTADVFDPATEAGKDNWTKLRDRVVEHNILVVADYYTRIGIDRLAQLLDLAAAETEKFLSDMVVAKMIDAKIDRLAARVFFEKRRERSPDDVLNEWSHNINDLMSIVNKVTHLISKEEMLHNKFCPISTADQNGH